VMRYPYLDRTWWWGLGAVDGVVKLGRLRWGAVRGGSNSGEGVPGVGPDQAGGLGEEVRK
jgi:hypothetical protein